MAPHALASQSALAVLREGGNAFDAAVAVSAVLSVVEPISSGLGGGGFFLLHDARSGRDVMVDARETAPASAAPAKYLDAKGELDNDKAQYFSFVGKKRPAAGRRPTSSCAPISGRRRTST